MSSHRSRLALAALLGAVSLFPLPPAAARPPLDGVPVVQVPSVDLPAVQAEDQQRAAAGLPPRFAIPHPVAITPQTHGLWQDLDADTRLWRLRIASPGAVSLNLGFAAYWMPPGGELRIYAADGHAALRPFTDADNAGHGELWTPVLLADDIVVEATVPPAEADRLVLALTSLNVGYRGFGAALAERSGWCNVDVICPEGDDWRDEIQSVAVISTGGSLFCSGFMVNNTAQDGTPYFMTANHCGISAGNAASLVVYWNFQSPTCGQQGGGSLGQYQTGAYFRAAHSASDFTLVELDQDPDPAWNISFAGWDRSTANPTSAVAIHHPQCDEKSISFEYQACTTTSYLGTSSPGDGTHVRVIDWDLGTTEPGSSGSPLFDQNHRVVGQLHGGYAACGNNDSDWYGRFSRSWTGGGTNATRLSNWLDPGNTGLMSIDTLAPGSSGLGVTPPAGLAASGDPGGPFAPPSQVYTLENKGDYPIDYEVTKSATWLTLSSAAGTLEPHATVAVTVTINANANALPAGLYDDTVSFTNTTDSLGDTTRPVTLEVGGPSLVYSFPMDTDPGWTGQGLWAWGRPTGGGGQYGFPDPTAGHSGLYVYGYNLNGDYESNLPQRHLTSTPLDCSALRRVTLRFWRYLGVERSTYDHAYVRVSRDGVNYTTVWENTAEVADSAWVPQELDISAVADGQPAVYLRWTMGPTDGTWQYCGWNIDDVEIWALVPQAPVCGDLNCDGVLDFADIDPFVLALDPSSPYEQLHPDCDRTRADCNGDGTADFDDIDAFVTALAA